MTGPIQPWVPIRIERLSLREFRETDFDDAHAYRSDPEVVRYSQWGPNTPDATRGFLDLHLTEPANFPRLAFGFAIEHAGSGRVVGSVALRLVDGSNRTAEIGYTLNRTYWGQGLATEACRALCHAAFGELGLHQVTATCDVRDIASF